MAGERDGFHEAFEALLVSLWNKGSANLQYKYCLFG